MFNNETKKKIIENLSLILYFVTTLIAIIIIYHNGLLVFSDDTFFSLNFNSAIYMYLYDYGSENMVLFALFWYLENIIFNSLLLVQAFFYLFIVFG